MTNNRVFDPKKLKAMIEQRGRTRDWVAKQAEITRGYLDSLLWGQRHPSPAVLKLIAISLETTVEELTARKSA